MNTLILMLCLSSDPVLTAPTIQPEGSRPDILARCANELIALGEEKAYQTLAEAAKKHWSAEVQYKIVLLTTLLYRVEAERPIRSPRLGAALFIPDEELPLEEWPVQPLAMVDDIPILVTHGYLLGGLPESASDYLELCRKEGKFRRAPFPIATHSQFERALQKLIASKRWSEISWTEGDEISKGQKAHESWVIQRVSSPLKVLPLDYKPGDVLRIMTDVAESMPDGKSETRSDYLARVGIDLARLSELKRMTTPAGTVESYRLNAEWRIEWRSKPGIFDGDPMISEVAIRNIATDKVVVRSQ